MAQFHVRISNDDLVFSAGHFITLEDGNCERLHGHTYRVTAQVSGPLDQQQCVVDFVVLRDSVKAIVAELDHRMLLPTEHPTIGVTVQAGEVEVTFALRRWVFPLDDCLLLPLANTTTEMLAQYVAVRLMAALSSGSSNMPAHMRVEICEGSGAAAICELP
jgi:6-pyruvoyltetrahydropterin/6-carboxytetrahydropterin synthase